MQTRSKINLSRRTFLKTSGACLVVGAMTSTPSHGAGSKAKTDINAFLKIDESGAITVYIGQAEIGQGTSTGFCMIVADELGAAWEDVQFEFATGRPEYFHPVIYQNEQITGGSMSIVGFMPIIQKAAAAAREMLIQAASARTGVPANQLNAVDGMVRDHDGRHEIPFGKLVVAAQQLETPESPKLRSPEERRLVGNATKRLDVPSKINGTAVFGVDVEVPDMLYASVRQVPVFGQKIDKLDSSAVEKLPGVVGVFQIPNGYAVVAKQYWQAVTALEKVVVSYIGEPLGKQTSEEILEHLTIAIDAEEAIEIDHHGNVDRVFKEHSDDVLEMHFDVPFLAHATMEPMNATASVVNNKAELWVPTQAVTLDQIAVAKALGIDQNNVKVNMTYSGGGFGRRGFSEYAVQAAVLSQQCNKPVKVLWSREEDIRQDYLRPAFAAKLRGYVNSSGRVEAIDARVAGPGVWKFNRPPVVEFFKGVDHLAIEGLHDTPYKTDNFRVQHVMTPTDRQIGYWRSIGYSHNTYFLEVFVDAMAKNANIDPLKLRLSMFKDDPRSERVLNKVAEISGWNERKTSERHLGLAFFATERWQTRVAQVVEVSSNEGRVKVERVFCVADVGFAVNPLSVEAQLQGAIIFGLTAAMYGQIDLDKGAVVQSNFADYRMLTLRDAPPVDVVLIEGASEPGSVGEIGTPCAAPALVNAVASATGKHVTSLPLSKHQLV